MRKLLLGTVSALALLVAHAHAAPITVAFTGAYESGPTPTGGSSALSGSVTFDPTTFSTWNGSAGEGAASSGSLTFSGLTSIDFPHATETFTEPTIALDVSYYNGSLGGPAEISIDTGVLNDPTFVPNADGFYLVALGSNVIEITDVNPNSVENENAVTSAATYTATFTTTIAAVPEPASAAVLGAGLLGLVGLRRRARRAV